MTKTISLLGIMVALSLAMIAYIGPAGNNDVMALEDNSARPASALCAKGKIADEGYGINQSLSSKCQQH